MKKNFKIVIAAIGSLTILEALALFKGIDGTIFSIVIAAIAGLAGWTAPQPKFLQK